MIIGRCELCTVIYRYENDRDEYWVYILDNMIRGEYAIKAKL